MQDKATRTAALFAVIPVAMLALAFAADPLYDTFCRVTGFGGTTRVATAAPTEISDRTVTVRFDANVASAPLKFRPLQTGRPTAVLPSYNVTPHKAGPYFNKLECFCFEERVFQPGETKKLPVVFFVDPALEEKALNRDIRTITLSYTFFEADDWQGSMRQAALD